MRRSNLDIAHTERGRFMYFYLYNHDGTFRNLEDFADLDHLGEQGYSPQLYVNLTNACDNDCTFCLRNNPSAEGSELWLEREADADELCALLDAYDLSPIDELVFCGFGEPTMRLGTLLAVAHHVRTMYPDIEVRVNTNGLANARHGRDVAPELARGVDRVSVSLNTADPGRYLELTRSKMGPSAHAEMLDFARAAKRAGIAVTMSVVDVIGADDVAACAELCRREGLDFRVRAYSAD